MIRADVCVVGSGPAGATIACRLARSGQDVCLVSKPRRDGVWEHLSPTVRTTLADLGVPLDILTVGAPTGGVAVSWDREPFVRTYLDRVDGPGFSVDRSSLDAALTTAAALSGACVVEGVVGPVELRPRHVRVKVKGAAQDEIRAAQVVDATGRRAFVAGQCGTVRRRRGDLIAASTTVDVDAIPGALLIEAAPDGWLFTIGTGTGCLVSWVTDRSSLHGDVAELLKATIATAPLTDEVIGGAPLAAVSLRAAGSGVLDRVVDQRWIAIGDAAAYSDPIWGQGVARALEVAERAAEYLIVPFSKRAAIRPLYHDAIIDTWREVEVGRDNFYRRGSERFESAFWQRYLAAVANFPVTSATLQSAQ